MFAGVRTTGAIASRNRIRRKEEERTKKVSPVVVEVGELGVTCFVRVVAVGVVVVEEEVIAVTGVGEGPVDLTSDLSALASSCNSLFPGSISNPASTSMKRAYIRKISFFY